MEALVNRLNDEAYQRKLGIKTGRQEPSSPKDFDKQRGKDRTRILQDMGFEAEAGWIDGPEGKNRELVVFDKAKVKASEMPQAEAIPPEAPAPAKGREVKKPWEMTRSDYWDALDEGKIEPLDGVIYKGSSGQMIDPHYAEVSRALERGDKIPTEVLNEYPKLAQQARLPRVEGVTEPSAEKAAPEYSPAVKEGMEAWLRNEAYVDNAGNYRLKENKKIVPWNKEVKKTFPRSEGLTDAAEISLPELTTYLKEKETKWGKRARYQSLSEEEFPRISKPVPASEKGAVGFDLNNIKEKSRVAQDPEARRVEEIYEKAETELTEFKSAKMKQVWERIKRLTTDTSSNIKRELLDKAGVQGKEVVMRHELSLGASAKAQAIIEKGFDRVYKDLSPVDEIILNRALRANRDLTILGYKPEHRVTGGLAPAELQKYIDAMPPKILERVKEYSKIMDENLTAMEEAGLINKDQTKNLREKGDYLKTNYIQHIDPERTSFDNRGRKITVPDSGIKKIDTGSEQAAEMNSRLLMAEVIGRTQGRIFRNKANEALYQYVKDNPDNPFGFKEAKIYKRTKGKIKAEEEMAWEDVPADYDMTEVKPEQKVSYRWEIPTGHTEVSVMQDGKRIRMVLPDKYAREWIQSDPMISSALANVIGWMLGTKILKTFATGMNPGFALTNLPRDIAHIWLVTGEYSKFAPKFLGQMGTDLKTVAKDTVTRKGRYQEYIDEGGGMSFLTHQGQLKLGGSGPLNTLQKWAGWIGETSEIWTRLAVRERAIKNGVTPEEATWIARNYLDFAQGGSLAKAADTGIPYLNASIQGTRMIVNAAKKDPSTFMWKVAQIGALATGLYIANTSVNKEAWDSVPEKEKVTNWIITTPFDYRDKDGNKRYLYFRIAKDQGQRVFASLFEGLMGMTLGHEVGIDQITSAMEDFLPIVPTEKLPPSFMAMLGYSANKDFWRNRDVWRGPKVESSKEFTKWTHPALKEAGEWTGLSPERLGYSLSQFIPPTNTYAALVGGGLRKMMEDLPEKEREKAWQEILQDVPMMNKLFRSTDPYEKYRKAIEKTKIDENTRRYEQRMKVERIVDETEDKPRPEKLKAQMNYVRTVLPEDRKRIMREFKEMDAYQGIEDRRWWLNLKHLPPESRAAVYYDRWKDLSPEEQMKIDRQGRKLPGIFSEGFNRKLFHLKKAGSTQ